MIKTIVSIVITLSLLLCACILENYYVNKVFAKFDYIVRTLYDKTEAQTATYEDGTAVQTFWEEKKRGLQVWLAHASIQEVDYQLYEAVGYLYVKDFESALPKLEIIIGMCENIPYSYTLSWENIF